MINFAQAYQDAVEETAELAVRAGFEIASSDSFLLPLREKIETAGFNFIEFVNSVHEEMLIILPIWKSESMSRAFKSASNVPGANTQ